MYNKNIKKWVALFIGPALFFLTLFLIYPSIQTFIFSFMGRRSEEFVGLDNFIYAFTSRAMLTSFRNNLMWIVFFTFGTVSLGLLMAILVDKVKYEKIAKSIIFMPMAVSFVGAGVIWKFIYDYKPMGANQIGLLNQILTSLGFQPKGWLIQGPLMNNFALIFVGLWIWTGFSMVILSAAYKGIPKDLLEAGRVDGANEWQVFRHIILPYMKPTIAVVATTMAVNVLKIFDIVYVMTNGNYGTEVIANRMYKEMFQYRNYGRASAIAVVLFVLVIPVIFMNVKRMRGEDQ
ncbi:MULTISPECIES: carbohydrate ABC transporter permease [Halanaerobium]|jgi:alpha-glucoside transport system permease protein|uniref:Alpha-glucoside transport system permease protein n=1 Tax=Halanaerobium kushneri TaxID=56779 RepID=A0A1N6YBP4_9FIRM|nr:MULTISPECIES: sugar ABC transporter permease [Halanaerobium]RCW51658.1 alpha-glucoside transport system permease protein [Halanaerobium sp. ST460_2HS_T2]SIR11931.1 alpha-glucoside transport system permease protein [Halanaerobium kushneri]